MRKTPNEARKSLTHTSSLTADVRERYSASADDRETVVCFLVFQDIGEPPSLIKYPVRDRREIGHAPQSESQ